LVVIVGCIIAIGAEDVDAVVGRGEQRCQKKQVGWCFSSEKNCHKPMPSERAGGLNASMGSWTSSLTVFSARTAAARTRSSQSGRMAYYGALEQRSVFFLFFLMIQTHQSYLIE
jgi:hypothetical protein